MTLKDIDPKTPDDEITKDWEANMHDFVPEDMTTLTITERSVIVYEDI